MRLRDDPGTTLIRSLMAQASGIPDKQPANQGLYDALELLASQLYINARGSGRRSRAHRINDVEDSIDVRGGDVEMR